MVVRVVLSAGVGSDAGHASVASGRRDGHGLRAIHAASTSDQESARLRNELIATVNHELRTPLTTVVGFSEILLTGDAGPLNTEQHSMISRVAINGLRLLELIEELVRTTSDCLVTDQAVDIAAVLRQVVNTPHVAEGAGSPYLCEGASA